MGSPDDVMFVEINGIPFLATISINFETGKHIWLQVQLSS